MALLAVSGGSTDPWIGGLIDLNRPSPYGLDLGILPLFPGRHSATDQMACSTNQFTRHMASDSSWKIAAGSPHTVLISTTPSPPLIEAELCLNIPLAAYITQEPSYRRPYPPRFVLPLGNLAAGSDYAGLARYWWGTSQISSS